MDFAALPPEVNSGRMYIGPGSGPTLAAAAAWDGVAAELRSAAAVYETTVSRLTGESWLGPSAAAMVAASAPYVAWLAATATQAEQTATQAKAAAAAYEAAFAMTVPPAVVAANRAQLMLLVATNVLGQNTAAIAATEAHYGEMWAQDAAAMHGYAGASAAATTLTPFTTPPQTTTGQTGAQAGIAPLAATTSGVAQAVAAPAQSLIPPIVSDLLSVESALAPGLTATSLALSAAAFNAASNNSRVLIRNTNEILDNHEVLLDTEQELLRGEEEIKGMLGGSRLSGGWTSALSGPGAGRPSLSAGLARALSVGKLSVPLNWAATAPEIRTAAYALPAANAVAAAPAAMAGPAGTAFSEMALAGMGGSALAGSVSRTQQPPGAAATAGRVKATQPSPDGPVMEMATGIRELGKLRESGFLTDAEFDEQKLNLLRHFQRSLAPAEPGSDSESGGEPMR